MNTSAVCDCHDLAPFFALLLTHSETPFFALLKLPSINPSPISKLRLAIKSLANRRRSFPEIPKSLSLTSAENNDGMSDKVDNDRAPHALVTLSSVSI